MRLVTHFTSKPPRQSANFPTRKNSPPRITIIFFFGTSVATLYPRKLGTTSHRKLQASLSRKRIPRASAKIFLRRAFPLVRSISGRFARAARIIIDARAEWRYTQRRQLDNARHNFARLLFLAPPPPPPSPLLRASTARL